MAITEKEVRKFLLVAILLLLVVISYLIIKPFLLSILSGLILAYLFIPVHRFFVKFVKSKTISALLVSLLVVVAIALTLWYVLPIVSNEVFELFKFSQNLNLSPVAKVIFPSASEQFLAQLDLTVKNAITQVTNSVVSSMFNILLNFAVIALHLLLVAFVFFFTLKDEEKLRAFCSGLLPFGKNQEKQIVKQFNDITKSVLYGHVVSGFIQGFLAAAALFIFKVPNALFLSIIALILSVLPLIGPGVVYVPVTLYLAISGQPIQATIFFLYNILFVSSAESIFRSHFVSRKTNISQAIILVGMVGGLFVFNVLGLILGPLILAYLVTFLRAYKENNLASFFES